MHNGENASEVLLFLYKQCKHHTKNAFSVYKWIHFGNVIICMDSSIISLHGNVNNSKFIKKIPLNLDQPPPLNFINDMKSHYNIIQSVFAIRKMLSRLQLPELFSLPKKPIKIIFWMLSLLIRYQNLDYVHGRSLETTTNE